MPAISEVEVTTESNPYWYKILPGWNTEVVFPVYLALMDIMIKLSKNEKLSEEEMKNLESLQQRIKILLEGGYLRNYSRKPKEQK